MTEKERENKLNTIKCTALKYVNTNELEIAIITMLSELEKHKIGCSCYMEELGFMKIQEGHEAVRNWINGFR